MTEIIVCVCVCVIDRSYYNRRAVIHSRLHSEYCTGATVQNVFQGMFGRANLPFKLFSANFLNV